MKNFLTIIIPLYFLSGCATFNPFIPPSNSGVIVDEGCELPPQEPITSNSMYRCTMKPYNVNGVRYVPKVPNIGETFTGIASWYGPNFHGGKTSNGEYYDMSSLTAAHKTLPMNTQVKVTNLENGQSTIVRINDRGPFVENRIIDLSYAAAQDIGLIKKGTAKVKLEVIDYDTIVDKYKKYEPFPKAVETISNIKEPEPSNSIKALKKVEVIKDTTAPIKKNTTTIKSSFPNYKVQLLSSNNKDKANQLAKKYATMFKSHKVKINEAGSGTHKLYRVVVDGFSTKRDAQAFIVNKGFMGALIVKD